MGLFDFFSKKKEGYLGDLSKTSILHKLSQVPHKDRDQKWNNDFISNLSEASFMCSDPQVVMGPDGFPYFQLNFPTPNEPFECYVVKNMIDDYLLKDWIGIVVNLSDGNPDWLLTNGDLVNFKLNSEFYTEPTFKKPAKSETLKKDTKALVSEPSESFLPTHTRNHIKKQLSEIGITKVKIFLMFRPDENVQELIFNLSPKQFDSTESFNNIMKLISWYLPSHYSICGMEENDETSKNFVNL